MVIIPWRKGYHTLTNKKLEGNTSRYRSCITAEIVELTENDSSNNNQDEVAARSAASLSYWAG
jgi:hypothetical protein